MPYLLVTGDFVKTGGMDRANFALAEYLAASGQELNLVAYRVAPELLAYPNVAFHQVPKPANSHLLGGFWLDWAGRRQAERLAKSGGRVLVNGGNCQWGDVNWVHYTHAAYQPVDQAGFLQQIKGGVAHRLFLGAEQAALQSARVVIVNSTRTKQDLIEHLEIPAHRLHRVYNGIDPQTFFPATPSEQKQLRPQLGWSVDRKIAVFIGALGDRRKGFDTLFAAWQQLCADSNWDVDLITIGVGAELPLWQQRAAEAGIGDRIQFLGFRADVPNLLRAADCLVAPTRYEAYGLGVHEALCCGLPAIVSANAGVAERYPADLSDLLLSNPDCVEELMARLHGWRTAQDSYRQRTEALATDLRRYTWTDMAAKIVEIIQLEHSAPERDRKRILGG
ncbi:MAG: glycosyltransferase family 4 protein [Aphanocapsa sp. GSE-SYN-MK-11-07L]|jgi:glycosyltransferase involved in cell wall biosynthesis|nr:glycosyltransferase family 4 protein [Aphanocapsa sp. GSE-SYN-MK-11-07L]